MSTHEGAHGSPAVAGQALERDARALLGQAMGYVAVTVGFAALGALPRPRSERRDRAAAGILLVIYPLIDVAASLIDARSQRSSARRPLLAGMLARRRRRAANPAARVLSAG